MFRLCLVTFLDVSGFRSVRAQVGGTGGLGGTAGQGGGGAAGGTAGAGGGGGAGAAGGGGGSAGGGGAGGQGGGGFGVLGVLNRAGFAAPGQAAVGGGGFIGRDQRRFRNPWNLQGAGGRQGRIFPFQTVGIEDGVGTGFNSNYGNFGLGGTLTGSNLGNGMLGGLPNSPGSGTVVSLPFGNSGGPGGNGFTGFPQGGSAVLPGLIVALQNGKFVKPWKQLNAGNGVKAVYLRPHPTGELQTTDLGGGVQVTYG